MTKSSLGICCTIAALGFSGISALKTDHSMETVRAVCDELGRCWETGSGYGVGAAPGYWYNPYSGYELHPPRNWPSKGFCPPGQQKKGNC
jgi:hypothetical protein